MNFELKVLLCIEETRLQLLCLEENAAKGATRIERGGTIDNFQRDFIQHHHVMMNEWMEQHKAQVDEQSEAIKEAQKWQMWGAAAFGLSAVLGLLVNMNRKK